MSGKEVVPQKGGEVSTEVFDWSQYDDLMENDGTERIRAKFPEIRLVTATSRMENAQKHGGEWWFSDVEGEAAFHAGPLEVVFLNALYGRALFGKDLQPLCMAGADEVPRDGMPLWGMSQFETKANQTFKVPHDQRWGGPQPKSCLLCPFHHFKLPGTDQQSPCRDGYVTLVIRTNPDLGPAQLRFNGTMLRPWREFNKMRLAVPRPDKKRGVPLFSFKATLTTKKEEANGNTWNQLIITPEKLGNTEIADFAILTRQVASEWQQVAQEYIPEDEADTRAVESAGGGWGDGQESYARPVDPEFTTPGSQPLPRSGGVPEEPAHVRDVPPDDEWAD